MSSLSAPALGQALQKRLAFTATALVLCISACKLLVHLYAGRHYGYFVDAPEGNLAASEKLGLKRLLGELGEWR